MEHRRRPPRPGWAGLLHLRGSSSGAAIEMAAAAAAAVAVRAAASSAHASMRSMLSNSLVPSAGPSLRSPPARLASPLLPLLEHPCSPSTRYRVGGMDCQNLNGCQQMQIDQSLISRPAQGEQPSPLLACRCKRETNLRPQERTKKSCEPRQHVSGLHARPSVLTSAPGPALVAGASTRNFARRDCACDVLEPAESRRQLVKCEMDRDGDYLLYVPRAPVFLGRILSNHLQSAIFFC